VARGCCKTGKHDLAGVADSPRAGEVFQVKYLKIYSIRCNNRYSGRSYRFLARGGLFDCWFDSSDCDHAALGQEAIHQVVSCIADYVDENAQQKIQTGKFNVQEKNLLTFC
jgi:hypothetical protein